MMFSLFEAIAADQVRDNRHTFYDVFEQVNAREVQNYKRQAGIQEMNASKEEFLKNLRESLEDSNEKTKTLKL